VGGREVHFRINAQGVPKLDIKDFDQGFLEKITFGN